MKNYLFLLGITLFLIFFGCSSSNSQPDGDSDNDTEKEISETFFYSRPEEPIYGDCVPGVAACSEDRRTGYLCDPYGQWMLWAEYREPVRCSICSDYMDMNTRTVDGKMFNPACSQYPGMANHDSTHLNQRPFPALYINENWEEGAAYDCFGEGFREFDPIECNGESGNLEIPYSGDRVHWRTKFKEDDPVENEPACSYRLEIPCSGSCVTDDLSGPSIYFWDRRRDYQNAHCVGEASMVTYNPGVPSILTQNLSVGDEICLHHGMRGYFGICIPEDSPYCMRWDNENDCPAGKDCIDGVCQPFDPNNVPQPPDGDLDQELDADSDLGTDGDAELVTEADETETLAEADLTEAM